MYGTGIVNPPFAVDSSSYSGAINIGYTAYPRSNVENYWWSQESPGTQWSMNTLYAGSSSCDESWGLYQITNPSMYGQYLNWDCDGAVEPAKGGCCPQYAPGVSYNTKMLIVYQSWMKQIAGHPDAGPGPGNPCIPIPGWIQIGDTTPLFYQVSSSGTAPCDTNGVSPYPWEEIIEWAKEFCPWTFQTPWDQANGLSGSLNWQNGMFTLLTNATAGPSIKNTSDTYLPDDGFGGILILRNNDVRGVDLFKCRQNWNPRLLNVYPLSGSVMYSATPASNEESAGSPYPDAMTSKPYANFNSPFKPYPTPVFSKNPGPNGEYYQSSESFYYPSVPYDFTIKTVIPGANYAQSSGSLTIEFLIKPAWDTGGSCIEGDDTIIVGGLDPYNPDGINGKWMPVMTKNGYQGEYSVWVNTSDSRSLAFGYSVNGGSNPNGNVWFTASMDILNGDQVDNGEEVWYHCAVTRNLDVDIGDNDALKWYLNGQYINRCRWNVSPSISNPNISPTQNLNVIASNRDSKNWSVNKAKMFYSGSIGFIRVYERALNQYQILTNFYKSGIWCEYDGYNEAIGYDYDWDGTIYPVQYNPNGGVNSSLQLMFDCGNLVSDQGFDNTTGSAIFNIRQYSSSMDADGFYITNGRWSGSQWPVGVNWSNDVRISQSIDGYQTYDSMNGARFFPGSVTDRTKPTDDDYAYMYSNHVYCETEDDEHNTVEMWLRLATTTGSNAGDGSSQRVVFLLKQYKPGGGHLQFTDWGLMYDENGFGFWDGSVHLGIPWSSCREYLSDRWVYVQAQFPTDTWNNTSQGYGSIIGLNGNYWGSVGMGEPAGDLSILSGTSWKNKNFTSTMSMNFMGNWNDVQEYNASGSIAEARWYASSLKYQGSASYAYGPSSFVTPDPGPWYPNTDNNSDTPYNWLIHNWNANKVRFGMGGDASWT